ncbi:valine--tRNA ligase [Candidatus Microgenomates bacterium]|nr:valine--tRNA ligase [Candidatus Microgenomates bacterium]
MEKTFQPAQFEDALYKEWEEKGLFTADNTSKKKPFSIILPPPNANADLHLGHAMYVYEDIMIRYHKLMGYETLWLPGADHAGFETQFVFEKHLAKQKKSRFDYDRKTLYKMIWDFVHENRDKMENQLRKLGFSLDWSRRKFTLDEDTVAIVLNTFKKLHDEGYVYRANRLVNYCTHCGTSFSDLEVSDKEVEGKLYYIDFPLTDGKGSLTIATTRPETLLGDVAVMVHPADPRYKDHIGKTVTLPIVGRTIPIIADEYVDPEFGTGAVKVTPNHDFNDFAIAKKHNLNHPPVIGFDGRMKNTGTEFDGKKVGPAREGIVERLKTDGLLKEIKDHHMVVKTCYKCGRTLEPLPLEQWYVKVRPLADRALASIEKGDVTFNTPAFKNRAVEWLTNFHDWNISRQIVWGIQIPAYRCISKNEWFVSVEPPSKCAICSECTFEQDTDTFDTWFSSAQWPFTTLKTTQPGDFDFFYSTSVMETGYDILPWWVCRMLMIGLYATDAVPFKSVYLHGLVRDIKGQKMSKSKGNVINPLETIEKYGCDALRASLVFEVGDGADQRLYDDKIRAMRNFANKIWNIGRFLEMNKTPPPPGTPLERGESGTSEAMLKALKKEYEDVKIEYHKNMKASKFSAGFGVAYEFLWHRFADFYIEALKQDLKDGNISTYQALEEVYLDSLRLLHPFVPFVTDAVYKQFCGKCILET